MLQRRCSVIAVALGVLVLGGVAVPQAHASHERWVTIAARYCDRYDQIFANRARNNIMESLRDLGPDSPYLANGVANIIRPQIEAQAPQDACHPLANWRFTLGRSYRTRAVDGPWGSLAKVLEPFDTPIVTQPSVPLRDDDGNVTAGTIYGATTIRLTSAQNDLADEGSKLWLQGGTPEAPLTDPDEYGFGALRCATDNLNGDNVEWIAYPADGTKHVFCFAYYVKPPPTSGTIRIEKQLDGVPAGSGAQKIGFFGNISFAPGGAFSITAGPAPTDVGSVEFIRAAYRPGDPEWSFQEQLGPLASLESLNCVSKLAGQGGTGSTWRAIGDDPRQPGASIRLAEGDVMTCRFVDSASLPASGLVLRKITRNGTGAFGFDVTGTQETSVTAETTLPGLVAVAGPEGNTLGLPSGSYRIEETSPASSGAGTWALESVSCARSTPELVGDSIRLSLPVPGGTGDGCTFVNRFTPGGRITIDKVTLGGTATARFQIDPQFDPDTEYEQTATTTRPGEAVRAEGESTAHIPIGDYEIRETIAGSEGSRGDWRVNAVVCNGVPVPSIESHIRITLTADQPDQHCEFVNELLRNDPPEPPEPPAPPSEPVPPPAPVPGAPEGGVAGASVRPAELAITKRARPRQVPLGGLVRYRVVVRNRGPATARQVTIGEGVVATRRDLRLRASRGSCREQLPRYCVIGRLAAGERAVIRVTVRTRRPGRFLNSVAVNTATPQRTTRNKSARARLTVRAIPRFTG